MATYGREIGGMMMAVTVLRTNAANHPADNNKGELTVIQVQTLLAIALHPGITTEDLKLTVGMEQSSASRNTSALSKTNQLTGKPGADYIEAVRDPRNTRPRLIYFLNARGRIAVQKALEALTGKPLGDFDSPTFKEWESRGYRR